MKTRIPWPEVVFSSGSFMIIVSLSLFLSGCSNDNTSPSDDYTECIVTDKTKLEQLEIFPSDNALNGDISEMPRDARSDAILILIGSPSLKADFGSGLYEGKPIGIPFILVCKTQSKVQVVFRGNAYDGNYGNESDPGPYPIPTNAPIEGNGTGDSHVLAVDVDNKILYELYNASVAGNSWEASSGAIWDLKINGTRPAGWTSADAAGLPILPLLVRYDEVAGGTIDHALRFTLSKSKVTKGYLPPANHLVNGTNAEPAAPTPMGMRIRLKRSYDISGFSLTNQVILTAMKKYGLVLTDIGSDLFFTGAPDDRWDNDDLRQLGNVKATDFEVVQMGDIIIK